MDFLFELIIEIVIEGTFEVATNDNIHVPVPLRILCAVIVIAVFGGIMSLMILGGIACMRGGEAVLGAILFAFSAGFAAVLVWLFIRAARRNN